MVHHVALSGAGLVLNAASLCSAVLDAAKARDLVKVELVFAVPLVASRDAMIASFGGMPLAGQPLLQGHGSPFPGVQPKVLANKDHGFGEFCAGISIGEAPDVHTCEWLALQLRP